MASRVSEPTVHLEIGSRLENVELVQIAVQAALQQLEVADEDCHKIGTAVREAVANAIEHGNALDPDKPVEVDFGREGRQIVIRIRDCGSGFDPNRVPDPLEPENLMRADGRGILIMKQFMDRIEYSFHPDRGTEITLWKRVSALREASDPPEEEKE